MGLGLDKNTLTGMLLIGLLMIGMFYFNSKSQLEFEAHQKMVKDSTELVQRQLAIKDSLYAAAHSIKLTDTSSKVAAINVFEKQPNVPEQFIVLENNVIKVTLTNKGGQPKMVELKKYKTFDGQPVILSRENNETDKISYKVNDGNNSTSETSDLTFTAGTVVDNADKSQSVNFTLKDSSGKEVTHAYTLGAGDDYMLDFNIELNGADKLLTQNTISLLWATQTTQVEKDNRYEKRQLQVGYVEDGKYDFETAARDNSKTYDKPLDWLSVKQQFFITALAAKNKFQTASVDWKVPQDSGSTLMTTTANLGIAITANNPTIPLQLYYGPSDYHILDKYNNGMAQIVPYGSGPFAFVKYINRHVLLPVFDFIASHITSMGIVILLLTLFIRLLTSPILYKSYVSGAKMKALKPEVDKLKAKHGDDKQAFSMDQMKLWKSAGVSPLGGCLPAVLQVPIFMSLYYFFQSNIALRGQSFLWSKDLASYDSIAHLPFSIPFYGDHVSLFTLTATATSMLISIYSMSNMQDDSNPVMKYMPYIFPVMLLGVFNNLPSALTWYYTISNSITLILQIVIQKYIIDHTKILAQIEANRKKPVKTSKLQQRIQDMQETNKKIQDMKNKNEARS
jgi:YidC/Oxa1 family membrane protein insertase